MKVVEKQVPRGGYISIREMDVGRVVVSVDDGSDGKFRARIRVFDGDETVLDEYRNGTTSQDAVGCAMAALRAKVLDAMRPAPPAGIGDAIVRVSPPAPVTQTLAMFDSTAAASEKPLGSRGHARVAHADDMSPEDALDAGVIALPRVRKGSERADDAVLSHGSFPRVARFAAGVVTSLRATGWPDAVGRLRVRDGSLVCIYLVTGRETVVVSRGSGHAYRSTNSVMTVCGLGVSPGFAFHVVYLGRSVTSRLLTKTTAQSLAERAGKTISTVGITCQACAEAVKRL